jgi:hypothetical protein
MTTLLGAAKTGGATAKLVNHRARTSNFLIITSQPTKLLFTLQVLSKIEI